MQTTRAITDSIRASYLDTEEGEPGEIRLLVVEDGWDATAIWVRNGHQAKFHMSWEGVRSDKAHTRTQPNHRATTTASVDDTLDETQAATPEAAAEPQPARTGAAPQRSKLRARR